MILNKLVLNVAVMDALQIPAIEIQKFPYLQARSLTKEIFLTPPLLMYFRAYMGKGRPLCLPK